MDLTYSESEQAFRAEAREWLEANVPHDLASGDTAAGFAQHLEWEKRLFEARWAVVSWPEAYGGREASLWEWLIFEEEYYRAGAPQRVTQNGIFLLAPTLFDFGTPEQQDRVLPRMAVAEDLWCQGWSEPGAGSDLAGLSTRAEIDGDELVVNGSKIWTSYAHLADYQELLVRTDPGSQKHGGISWVICHMNYPGITIRPVPFVTREHHFNQVFYDDVRIPIENVVGEINQGWKVAMSTLSFERGTAFTLTQVMLAQHIDKLIDRAKTKSVNGKETFADSEIGRRLTKLRAEAAALRAMTYLAVAKNVRRPQPGPDGSMLKILVSRLKTEAESIALELVGSEVVELNEDTGHYLRSFASKVGGGTDEIQHNIVAQRVLGLPRQS